MSDERTIRTIREERTFSDAAEALAADTRRWDEIMEGVTWTLARDPFDEASSAVSSADQNLRLIFTTAFPPDIPALRILYRVEADNVHVTLLYVAENPDAEETDIIG